MEKIGTNLAYTGIDGSPVLSQTFTFTSTEVEVADLRDQIKTEGFGHVEAGVYASTALPKPDPNMVEWLTGGVLTLDEFGKMTSPDPAVMAWLGAVTAKGRVW